ncbi:sporulation protein YunB [Bacillota bacterium]
MKGRSRNHRQRKAYYTIVIICAVLIGYGLFFTGKVIKPAIASIGEIKAKSMMVQEVNEAIREKYRQYGSFESLLKIDVDDKGKVTLIQTDSAAINRLSYDLAWDIQQRLKDIKEERIQIPVGTIFGSQILSQTGPKVKLKILPLGTAKIVFKTEMSEAGINQTKYKIYLDVVNSARVIVPFSNNMIEVETTLLIAEAVILGEIPDSYIVVPKENMLDALDQ